MSKFQCVSTDSKYGDIRMDDSPTKSGETPSDSGFVPRDVSTLNTDELRSSNYFTNEFHVSDVSNISTNARLPRIKIQEFDGDVTKWAEFYELFQVLVGNTNLSKILKFSYLRSFLRGEALRMISGISLSDSNYDIALQTLQNRYDKCKIVATRLRRELLNLPTCEMDNGQLEDFYISAMKIFRQLENLQQNPDNFEFGFLLENKLPREIIKEIYSTSQLKPENVSAKVVLLKLQEIVKRETLIDEIIGDRSNIKPNRMPKVVTFQINHKGSKSKLTCYLCGKRNHSVKNCFKYRDIGDKYTRLLEKKRCIRCFGDHPTEHCDSDDKCPKCGKNHHVMFCFILSN